MDLVCDFLFIVFQYILVDFIAVILNPGVISFSRTVFFPQRTLGVAADIPTTPVPK